MIVYAVLVINVRGGFDYHRGFLQLQRAERFYHLCRLFGFIVCEPSSVEWALD